MHRSNIQSRSVFVERIERDYAHYFDGAHVLCYLHVRNLKYYNRIHGVEAGDDVLHSIIDMLVVEATNGLVARYAGHGLVFVTKHDKADLVMEKIDALLPSSGEAKRLRANVGAIVCQGWLSVDDCLRRAVFACHDIGGKRPGITMFDDEVARAYDKRTYIIDHLDDAIAAGEIQAWAQPIVRILTGRVCEVEVLARWQSRRYGFLYPNEFVPVLEEHQLIHKLDLEVIRLACEQWAIASQHGFCVPFGINLSRLDFELCDIYSEIRAIMACHGVPVDQLHVEVTESQALSDDTEMTEGVRRFREAGFSIYMDDFGSGYSSLGQMADMHFDVIKIDKSLLDHVVENERARAVLADTVSLVKRLGMQTLCEGVETSAQLNILRAIGCEKAQGYYFGRPASTEDTMRHLEEAISVHEKSEDNGYLNAICAVNLIEGTSASIHGVEASAFLGRNPVAVLEVEGNQMRHLASNFAFQRLVMHIGYSSFDELTLLGTKTAERILARAVQSSRASRSTGQMQQFDFIAGGVFCSANVVFIAESEGREAYLYNVTSVQNAPAITEHTLLMGVLETSNLCFFWKDTKRRFLGCNQRFLDYYGFDGIAAILGKTDEDMGWHENNEPFHNDELDVLQGHVVSAAPGVCRCRGEFRDIIATKRPLYSHGEIVGLVGFFEDVGPHSVD